MRKPGAAWPANSLSLCYATVEGAHPVAQIEAAAAAGFDGVTLRLFPTRGAVLPHPIEDRPETARAVRQALAATGLRVLDAEVAILSGPLDRERARARVALAAELGCTFLLTVVEDPDRGAAAEALAALCEVAGEAGIAVALEFMAFRAVATLRDAVALVEASRADAKILVDALHLARSGGTPAAVAALDPSRLASLQLCDAGPSAPGGDLVAEARTARLDPGTGVLPLVDLLRAVPAALPMSVEVPRADRLDLTVLERARIAAAHARRVLDATRPA